MSWCSLCLFTNNWERETQFLSLELLTSCATLGKSLNCSIPWALVSWICTIMACRCFLALSFTVFLFLCWWSYEPLTEGKTLVAINYKAGSKLACGLSICLLGWSAAVSFHSASLVCHPLPPSEVSWCPVPVLSCVTGWCLIFVSHLFLLFSLLGDRISLLLMSSKVFGASLSMHCVSCCRRCSMFTSHCPGTSQTWWMTNEHWTEIFLF